MATYKVQENGKAQSGLSTGDQVVTAGGTYTITGVNSDGTYKSELSDKNTNTSNYNGAYSNADNSSVSSSSGSSNGEYSGTATKNITTNDAVQQAVKEEMDKNSAKWWDVQKAYEAGTITDAERQAQQAKLHDANVAYQTEYLGSGVTYDKNTGAWSGTGTATEQAKKTSSSTTSTKSASSNGYAYDASGLTDTLKSWLEAAKKQSDTSVDYATNQAILELQRAQEDAKAQYDTQRNQIAEDEQRALDNQALYAEARGDKGGIGQAQYNSIMNTAAINRLSVNSAQVKLSTDTARQIADLRAQGEFEKADAYLELTQQYLQQLISLEQWSAEFGLSVAQFNASLEQWQAEYDLKVADITGTYQGQQTLASKQLLAEAGLALAENGITPSSSQISAMKELYGYDSATVSSLVTAAQLSATESSSKKVTEKAPDYKTDPLGYLMYYGTEIDYDAAYYRLISAGMDETTADYYAKQYAQSATNYNVAKAAMLTEDEWNKRRKSYLQYGTGSSAVIDFATYAAYKKDYMEYLSYLKSNIK